MKNWLKSVPPVVPTPSETVSDEMEMADGTEGNPPVAVETPETSAAGETSEAAENPVSAVEETTPPSTEEPSAILSPRSGSRRYPARNRQPPSRYNPSLFGTNYVIIC